jgi:Leucine-rich repeat (LRR) protein
VPGQLYEMDTSRVAGAATRRIRFHYRLTTLFILITALCIALGEWTRRARNQQAAVVALTNIGASIYYNYQERPHRNGLPDFYFDLDPKRKPDLPGWLVKQFGVDFFYDVVYVALHPSDWATVDPARLAGTRENVVRHLGALKKLRVLDLDGRFVTDDTLRIAGGLRRLEFIAVDNAAEITDEGVAHLAHLHELLAVRLADAQASDRSLLTLAQLRSLEELSLDGANISDRGLACLSDNVRLRGLSVRRSRGSITDVSMESLSNLVNLEELLLSDTKVTSAGLKRLAHLSKLRVLWLTGNADVTDEGICYLASVAHLEDLRLGNTGITPDCLTALKDVRRLNLCGDERVGDGWIPQIIKLNNLEELEVSYTSLTTEGLRGLKVLPKLESLAFAGTAADANELAEALPGCFLWDSDFTHLPGDD